MLQGEVWMTAACTKGNDMGRRRPIENTLDISDFDDNDPIVDTENGGAIVAIMGDIRPTTMMLMAIRTEVLTPS
jgi:hypothetical protein